MRCFEKKSKYLVVLFKSVMEGKKYIYTSSVLLVKSLVFGRSYLQIPRLLGI